MTSQIKCIPKNSKSQQISLCSQMFMRIMKLVNRLYGVITLISYKPLLKLLIDRDIKKTDLMKIAEISSSTMAKIGKGEYVALEVIDRICAALGVQPANIIEYVPAENNSDSK